MYHLKFFTGDNCGECAYKIVKFLNNENIGMKQIIKINFEPSEDEEWDSSAILIYIQ